MEALITLSNAVAITVRYVLDPAITVELANTTPTSVPTAGMVVPIVTIDAQIAVCAIGA